MQEQAHHAIARPAPAGLHAARILLVDDEASNLRFLELMLQLEGYRDITSVQDARRVAAMCQAHVFDLVLLDIKMPYLDGFEVMTQVHASSHDPYLPFLVLTAQADLDTRLRALEAGARDFISKPFVRQEVLTRIRNILEVRLLQNDLQAQNRLLDQRVNQRTRELQETRLEIIRRLGRAAEYRDNETGLHIIRMSQYAELLGRAAGMDPADAENLLHASPMHDIGKIGIPDDILLKPGRLDAQEWATMQRHAAIGAEILSGHDSELLGTARLIALTHHEKWDGSGYPNHLKGEHIPLVGRIVATCDVFDALVSERPYKKAWSVDDALEEIRRLAGSHLDPRMVGLFLQHLPQVLQIRQRYAEPESGAAPGELR